MITKDINSQTSSGFITKLLLQFSIIVFLIYIFALIFHETWVRHINLYHTILELGCIFVALCIFIAVWFTYKENSSISHILGFGYLSVAIFDGLHTFFFLKLNLTSQSYFDLSTRYWILGRLAEALVLFLALGSIKVKLNKWTNLSIAILSTVFISRFIITSHHALPLLLTEQGVTPIKVVLEYIIIAVYFIGLYRLKNKLLDDDMITYRYIALSLLMSICSEFCFTLYSSVTSISWTVGHVARLISYYFLFKGVFITTVTYPYKRIEVEKAKLEQINEVLNDTSQALKDLLDDLPIAVQKYDRSGKLTYVNKKFEQLLACDGKSLYGLENHQLMEIFLDKEHQGEVSNINNLSPDYNNEIIRVIRNHKTLKGDKIKLSINTLSTISGNLVLFEDVSIKQKLENLHIQTDTILNAVNNCIIMINKDRKIILFNKSAEEVYEVDRTQVIGMDIDQFNDMIDFSDKYMPDIVLNDNYQNKLHEVSFTSFKGNKKELLLCLASIKDVEGEVIGGISASTDVTEIKKEQNRMLQQEKLALLGQMGAGIVHETRNYLTTIKGRCQLIEMLTQNDNVKKHALRIDDEVEEVNRIISEFLFLSKPRETELQEVSLLDIFQSIKGMIETTSLVKGVDIDFYLSKEERYLRCDEGQLKQVILNICKNAVDAMADIQQAKLKVETGYSEITNEMFIKVSDNGKGMPEQDLKKIGTPFFTTKKSGTGLGLSACYQIIENHKGRIEINSIQGQGTTVIVILPCIDDKELEEAI